MEKSKLVSRYMGSMAGIAVVLGTAAFLILFKPETLAPACASVAKLTSFLKPLPGSKLATWWRLAGLYLLGQCLTFSLAAAFPARSSYRATCLFSAAAGATTLTLLFLREGPYAPFFVGALWQAALALWVGWLLLLEAWQRPFSDRKNSPKNPSPPSEAAPQSP